MPPKRSKRGRPPNRKPKKSIALSQRFPCINCKQHFTKLRLARHLPKCLPQIRPDEIYIPKVTYNCTECSKKFKFKTNFKQHCVNEHSKLPNSISCEQCHVRCPNKDVLEKHKQNIHERKEFKCPHCKKKFVRHSHVLRHLAQSGCDGNGVLLHCCEICDAKFTRKDNLQVHLRVQHIMKKGFFCKFCQYTTKSFSKLVKHWQEQHLESYKFECDHCGKTTSSRAAMAKHLEIHGEKSHHCDVCGYSTYTAEVLRRHTLTHANEKPYKCTLCDKSFIQRSQLQRHLEKHVGNRCSVCDCNFNTKSGLLIHIREHEGLQKLICPFGDCNYKKVFSNEQSLNAHIKTHLDEKSYACEVCGKQFHTEVNMQRHVSTHRLDRPRRCMYCVKARAYIRGEQLLRHVRKLHPTIFRQHLVHVRQVLGTNVGIERVKKSELESILNVLDAESDRIIEGCSGEDILYGGMQVQDDKMKTEDSPLMSEDELVENLKTLLSQLIDKDTLECFGWPDETVDVVLEKVIEHCGARAADRDRWTRVQCLRENTKHLFLYAVEDKNIARMLDTHTIDQIVKNIIMQVSDEVDVKKRKS
ncbi:gastrula zinc finger protein XlCGF57.1-like [Achroia grisella]|uniref:gastrula zinc finger protein XlCGF57.1-like n=1 Tax=Achroia grisella TaxID=688607 RepID=UPI0027D26D26|nr:gastrula zinc finger protein XlCGF57.1-like [Achroia grisella]